MTLKKEDEISFINVNKTKLKITIEDLPQLWGKYIVEIDSGNTEDLQTLINKKSDKTYYFRKGIRQYFPIYERDDSYQKKIFVVFPSGDSYLSNETKEEFVVEFNYNPNKDYRLLTTQELDLVFKYIKSNLYE